jgi:hypothetical protein
LDVIWAFGLRNPHRFAFDTGPSRKLLLSNIDASDGLEKSLLEIIGGGTPAPRADLRFGRDDEGDIYLVTKRDGSIRRLAGNPVPVPGLSSFGLGVLGALLLTLGVSALRSPRRTRMSRPSG